MHGWPHRQDDDWPYLTLAIVLAIVISALALFVSF